MSNTPSTKGKRIVESDLLQDENHSGNVYNLSQTVLVIPTSSYGDSELKKQRILRNEKLRADILELRDHTPTGMTCDEVVNRLLDFTEDLLA